MHSGILLKCNNRAAWAVEGVFFNELNCKSYDVD